MRRPDRMRARFTAALCVAMTATAMGCGKVPAQESSHAQVPAEVAGPGDALDELVVDLDDHLSDDAVAALEERYGASFLPVSSYVQHDRLYRVRVGGGGEKGPLLQRLLSALRRDPAVEAADVSLLYRLPETAPGALTTAADEGLPVGPKDDGGVTFPNDPKYRYQWHMDQLHMPRAWSLAQGQGVTVAVVDTGVTQVEDLQGTEIVPGWNFVTNTADARDDHGHGTHVAGTIAQTTHNGIGVTGVAYKAKIMPIKVLSGQGSGSVGGIADGIRWAVDHGAQVINMSLGGRFNSQVLERAVAYAHKKGVTVVCAAGNDGKGRVSYPAANTGAIAVAATQYDEATTFYSNWGKEIAVAAPGGNTRLDQNEDGYPDGVLQNTVTPGNIAKQDYLLFMGTSMASPHVAGVAALLYSAGVTSPKEIERLLRETSRKPKQYQGKHDDHYGAGIVDASAALKAAQQERGGRQLGVTVGVLGLLALGLRRRLGLMGWLAAAAVGGGLCFLPAVMPGQAAGLLAVGVPALAGATLLGHGNPLVYSALLPVLLVGLLYGQRRLRGVLGGVAVGWGAVLAYTWLSGATGLAWLPASLGGAWLAVNALLCVGLGGLIMDRGASRCAIGKK